MRFDHLVIHTDNDPQKLQALKEQLNGQGYPFDPDKGKHNSEFWASNINISGEYLEVVRMMKPNAQTWMPVWAHNYDEGQRGVFCIFLEVEDAERTGVALKHAGIRARGPAVLTYPALFGMLRTDSPYFIYYLPSFPETCLQMAVMQYRKPGLRQSFQAGMAPNAEENGINGIRRIEVELPNLEDSMDMLQKLFADLHMENGEWVVMLEKLRMAFRRSPDANPHVRLMTTTSQRSLVGKKFQIENVEVQTIGG